MNSYRSRRTEVAELLKVANLSKSFGELQVLTDISFTITGSRFVTFVGPSGCGKSTLFKILLELVQPDGGQVVRGYDSSGYLPQEGLLFPWKTLKENVELPLELRGVPPAEREERVLSHLETFGLNGFEGSYPRQLSGGMRQRGALLRTILTDAEILYLDEPFGSLDAITRDRLQKWLLGVLDQIDQTILFITHDVEEAVFLSDRVTMLSGRPARKKAEISVDLTREERDKTSEKFFTYQKQVFSYIEEENHG